jgi:hypothetical protein
MESITMGDLLQTGVFLLTFITTGIGLVKYAEKGVDKVLGKRLEPFDKKIDEVDKSNKERFLALQLQTDKNYLVRFLADIETDTKVDETEMEHFWYTYDNYHKLGGNSYIDHKVEKLRKEGRL